MDSNLKNIKGLPIYNKALEIFKISRVLACSVSDNKHVMEMGFSNNINELYAGEIVTNSLMLAPGVAAVESISSYPLKIKRANNLRKAASRMLKRCKKLEFNGVKEKEFVAILKDEIRNFDILFQDWMYNIQNQNEKN